jgi:hypothetical protein
MMEAIGNGLPASPQVLEEFCTVFNAEKFKLIARMGEQDYRDKGGL